MVSIRYDSYRKTGLASRQDPGVRVRGRNRTARLATDSYAIQVAIAGGYPDVLFPEGDRHGSDLHGRSAQDSKSVHQIGRGS
jgi:1-acyl-sn-glycerol-3-phosphate acyltransferase